MIKRIAILLLLSASAAQATIARVQFKSANTAATNATTLAIVMDATPTAGNMLVVSAAIGSAASTICRMSEQTGITWLEQTRSGTNGNHLFAVGRVASTIASATITVSANATSPISAVAAEYSGTNIRVDKAASAVGTSTSAASGATETTSTAAELWVGAITSRSSSTPVTFSAPTNSFSIVAQTTTSVGGTNSDNSAALLDQVVAATGTPNAGATVSASQNWVASVLTFEEVTSAAAAQTRIPSIGSN